MSRYRKKKGVGRYRKKRRLIGNPMIRDFLVGTFGKVLDVVLVIAGAFLLIDGLIFGSVGKIIGGVLCLGASFGIMYALGHIVRFRR
jgi:hypothetical protein